MNGRSPRLISGGSVRLVLARLRDGARRLQARGLDVVCAWVCLLLTLLMVLPVALAAWLPQPHPALQGVHPIELVIQPLGLYAMMLAAASACAWRAGGVLRAFGLTGGCPRQEVRQGVFYGLALVPCVLAVSWAVYHVGRAAGFEPAPQDAFNLLSDKRFPAWSRMSLALLAALAAPLAEEALFRGVLLASLLPRCGWFAALLLQSGLFAAAHCHAASFIPLLAAGIGFGAGYAATGSLVTPIVMHMLFNTASLALFFAFP